MDDMVKLIELSMDVVMINKRKMLIRLNQNGMQPVVLLYPRNTRTQRLIVIGCCIPYPYDLRWIRSGKTEELSVIV
mgnify:CR=1 FL=1